jgi:hypothetical protein
MRATGNAAGRWLPAPNGPFFLRPAVVLPKPEALDGRWKAPQMQQAG